MAMMPSEGNTVSCTNSLSLRIRTGKLRGLLNYLVVGRGDLLGENGGYQRMYDQGLEEVGWGPGLLHVMSALYVAVDAHPIHRCQGYCLMPPPQQNGSGNRRPPAVRVNRYFN